MGKTECIIFGSKRKLRKINNFSVECNGHTIKAQRSVKYLKSMVGLNFFIDNVTFWRKNLGIPYVLHLSNVT